MLNNKQKRFLKAEGNSLRAIFQVGKDGTTPNLFKTIDDSLTAHELIKISILKTYDGLPTKELAELICSTIDAEFIHTVGRTFVIYKKNNDRNQYEVK